MVTTKDESLDEIIADMRRILKEEKELLSSDKSSVSYIDELIERDKAVEPVLSHSVYSCPKCKVTFFDVGSDDVMYMPKETYCWRCGQHLKWEGVNEN